MTLGAFALAGLCVRLGFWQWHRMEHKKHQQAVIERHLGEEPVPLRSVVRSGRAVTEDQEWTRVTAIGRRELASSNDPRTARRDFGREAKTNPRGHLGHTAVGADLRGQADAALRIAIFL